MGVRCAVHPCKNVLAAQRVIQRAGASAQVQPGGKGSGDVAFGPRDGLRQGIPLGQVRRNGAGKGAAGAVGVGVCDPPPREPGLGAVGLHQ